MPNNPFSDFANALGGAFWGDPRQQALGNFYGQRSLNQNLRNRQLQTEIAEHDALVKGLAENPDMLNAIRSGEGFSSAKVNLGKEKGRAAGENRLVEGLAEIAKKDPYLANQYKVGRTGSDIRQEANIPFDKAAEGRLAAEDKRLTDALDALKNSGNPEDAKLAQQLELKLSGADIRALNRRPLDEAESAAKVAGQEAETLQTKIKTRGLRKKQRQEAKTFNQNTRKVNQEMIQARRKNEAQLRELEQKINKETNINEIKKLELNKAKLLSKNNALEAEVAKLELEKKQKELNLEVKALENKTTKDFFKEYAIQRKDFTAAVEKQMERIAGTIAGEFLGSGKKPSQILLKDGTLIAGDKLSLSQQRQLAVYDVLMTMGVNPEKLNKDQKKGFGLTDFNRNEIEKIIEPEAEKPPEEPDFFDKLNPFSGSSDDKKPSNNQSDLSSALGGDGGNQAKANSLTEALKNPKVSEDDLWDLLDRANNDGKENLASLIMAELESRGATERIINAPVNP
jgi:hypothetical protein